MDSHAWEADLAAIRAGTAPTTRLWLRYAVWRPVRQEESEAWIEAYADDSGRRPLVRVPVAPDLPLPESLGWADVVGWPEPGRCFGLAAGPVHPLGPAYPLRPPSPDWLWRAALAAVGVVGLVVSVAFGALFFVALVLATLAVVPLGRWAVRRWEALP